MSFLDIKDPAERATLVKQRNMVNREMKLAIGDERQTLFHPIVNATKQAAEDTRKELAPMKKPLTDIDGALNSATDVKSIEDIDTTFGFYMEDGQLSIRIKAVQLNGNTLIVDDTENKFTPGLRALITWKQPQSTQWNPNDYQTYTNLVAQTKVRSFPNRTGNTRPHATWKWKQFLKQTVIPMERIPKEEEEGFGDTDDASVADPGESSHRSLSDMLSSAHTRCSRSVLTSPIHRRSLPPSPIMYSLSWKS